jgi:alginate O-acetyltransferase complex protein AlgI
MQFDSFTFVLFFAVVFTLYGVLRSSGAKKQLLLIASLVFYAGWNPWFLPLLLITSSFDFWVGQKILRAENTQKWRWLMLSLVSNLLVLSYFKYRYFVAENVDLLLHTQLLAAIKADTRAWVLPVGISFYTFQSMSYCIDCYRSQVQRDVSWLDFTIYVAFFPQLVAGPIVRFTDFYPQLQNLSAKVRSADHWGQGFALIVLGLFLKVVLADSVFAPISDQVFGAKAGLMGWAQAVSGMLAFSGQIFCDFAGYSTCAIGCARALGFDLIENFQAPYAAVGFSDFWRRWHISLSTWLRDYLYIPLGGNRFGAVRTFVALSLTMLLGGLWHGAAWTFVIWGALHGTLLVIERSLQPFIARLKFPGKACLGWLITLSGVLLAWVFFRATDIAQAWQICTALWQTPKLPERAMWLMWFAFFALVGMHLLERKYTLSRRFLGLPAPLMALSLSILLAAIALSPGNSRAFIYFQF